jgi:hypothetical protein
MKNKRQVLPVEVPIKFDPDVYKALRTIAKAQKKTRQQVVNEIIRIYHDYYMPAIEGDKIETQSKP